MMLWNDCDSCDTWLLFLIFSNLNGRLCLLQLYQLIYTGIMNTNTIHVALRYFFRRQEIKANRVVCDVKQSIGRIIICRSLFIDLWTFPPVKKSRTFTWTDPAQAMAYWNNELSCQTCKECCSVQYLCSWVSKSWIYRYLSEPQNISSSLPSWLKYMVGAPNAPLSTASSVT